MRLILTVSLVTLAACVSSAQGVTSIPAWYLNPPATPGAVTAAGSGETKLSAVAAAIGAAADQISLHAVTTGRTTVDSLAVGDERSSSRRVVSHSIGGLLVETLTKRVNGGDSIVTFSRAIKATTHDSSAVLKSFATQVNDSDPMRSVSLDGNLQSILDELAKAGARLRTQEIGNQYFVLLTVPAPKKP